MSNQDTDLSDQTARKTEAIADIELSISNIEQAGREPDQWERVFLIQAIAMLFKGAYDLAKVDAVLADTPTSGRSPAPNLPDDPMYDGCTVALLRKALREAIAEPVRQFPHFGPILFAGDRRQ